MEFADALKILAVSRHFDDIDLALRFVGCVRSDEVTPLGTGAADLTEDGSGAPAGDGLPVRGITDGWSMLSDAELDAAADDTAAGTGEAAGGHGRGHYTRLDPRRRAGTTPSGTPEFVVPFVLDADREPTVAPRYDSVPVPVVVRERTSAAYRVVDPRTAAVTMHTLLKRPVHSAEVDVDEMVRLLSLALPVIEAPRLERDQTSPPMHLLYDTSLTIGPYADDVRHLIDIAHGLLAENIEIRAFRGSPRSGCGSGPVWTWRPFRAPAQPSTVLFISGSFGEHLQRRVREVEKVIAELQRKGHHARVLWLGRPPGLGESSRKSWRVIVT